MPRNWWLYSGTVQVFNSITLAGGTLSANSSNNGIFNSTVNVTAGSTLAAVFFQTPATSPQITSPSTR